MKAYTDLEQSKKLAEILPIESADMHYLFDIVFMELENIPTITEENDHFILFPKDIPCWSLSALFDILPDDTNIIKDKSDTENEKYMCTVGVKGDIISTFGNNPVDVCYEMILKLHELNLL